MGNIVFRTRPNKKQNLILASMRNVKDIFCFRSKHMFESIHSNEQLYPQILLTFTILLEFLRHSVSISLTCNVLMELYNYPFVFTHPCLHKNSNHKLYCFRTFVHAAHEYRINMDERSRWLILLRAIRVCAVISNMYSHERSDALIQSPRRRRKLANSLLLRS